MKKHLTSGKVRLMRHPVKKQKPPKKRNKTIEQEYQQTFTPHTLPYQGIYSDDDSLEQPSELKYVPTTSTPRVEA
jgi:hypothetical protein